MVHWLKDVSDRGLDTIYGRHWIFNRWEWREQLERELGVYSRNKFDQEKLIENKTHGIRITSDIGRPLRTVEYISGVVPVEVIEGELISHFNKIE
ncbi:hypothetical protein [Paenibacillus dendritiformis]|uniref:hypothetical protein n=1 Tax=Paenibacillus dendritiformis TaxID=130049 RepID=UPI00387E0F1B